MDGNFTMTLILLGIGILLLVLEMFMPGFGVAGLLGLIALFAAVMLQIGNPAGIVFMVALVLFLLAVGMMVFVHMAYKGKLDKSPIVLKERIEGESTEISDDSIQQYVGCTGMALTPLRPAGKAVFDNKTLDVSTGGEFLPSGAQVEVVAVEGLRVLVRVVAEEFPPVTT